METEPVYRPLEDSEATRLIDAASRNTGALVTEENGSAVEEALKNNGFETVDIDIRNCIEGSPENPLQLAVDATAQKMPELSTEGITEFDAILHRLAIQARGRKLAFLIRVPSNRPSQNKDPAYGFLFSILKNSRGFSSRQRDSSHIAVLLYSGDRRPYNETNSDPLTNVFTLKGGKNFAASPNTRFAARFRKRSAHPSCPRFTASAAARYYTAVQLRKVWDVSRSASPLPEPERKYPQRWGRFSFRDDYADAAEGLVTLPRIDRSPRG